MNPQEEKFVKFWAPKSQLGRFRYSLYYGSLVFGLITWVGSLTFGHFLFDNPVTWERALVGLPIWLITGFFAFGWFQWTPNEKRYQQLINPAPKEDARATDGV
jgi:hypothetical protein